MSGEIAEARERLIERREAAGLGDIALRDGDMEAVVRRSLSGLDLDFNELLDVAASVRCTAMLAAGLTGGGPGFGAAAAWIEGVSVGLLIAEAREKAGQSV